MMKSRKIFGVFAVLWFCNVEAMSTYKECTVYEPGEKGSDYKLLCRFCIPSYDSSETGQSTRTYCREYYCSSVIPNCDNPVNEGCCFSCPGQCGYAGRNYYIGDKFKCLDGINKCKCTDTGVVTKLTNKPYNKDTLCEPRHYGACSLYEDYEQKARIDKDGSVKQGPCLKEMLNGRKVDICREYNCGLDLTCEMNWEKSADDGCLFCQGTCMYGGRIVVVNTTFVCMDGVNNCTCTNGGTVIQITSVKPTIDSLCKQYGKCELYSKGQEKNGRCSECRLYPGVYFADICREYTCATNNCYSPSDNDSCCPSCPGTCNYGGKVYQAGANFTCMNGLDKCSCHDNGKVTLRTGWGSIFPFEKYCFSS